jgi:hypothetical protein
MENFSESYNCKPGDINDGAGDCPYIKWNANKYTLPYEIKTEVATFNITKKRGIISAKKISP